MRALKPLQYCLLIFICLGVVACVPSDQGNSSTNSYDEEGIQSAGIGNEASFGSDNEKGSSLKAPCHQIYYFAFDDSAIHDADRASIEAQAKYLVKHPYAKVRLEGNTDNRGSREYNIALGERRAASVADILKLNGVSSKQIKIVSYGAQKSVAFGDTEEDYQLNRRVELFYERK